MLKVQFVGSVPGDPAAAPTIVLLRIAFVPASSNNPPRHASVVGSWSMRSVFAATVSSTPDEFTRVAVAPERVNVNPRAASVSEMVADVKSSTIPDWMRPSVVQ